MATICLNMIVKNEAQVIGRCLESVRPFVDHFVICDTGSTDGTQDIVRESLAGIPGAVHERPWRNFGHNRNEALELARDTADYLLIIDADESLRLPEAYQRPELSGDAYYMHIEDCGTIYSRGALVSTKIGWNWTGVLHEYLASTPAAEFEQLDWPRIVRSHDGARARDPKTYEKDAAILERALAAEPKNSRYAFYLAQSYRDAGQHGKSRAAYRRRAAMPGWDEETWYALYEVGRMCERMGTSPSEVRDAYLTAYQFRPTRAEPLYQLARYHRERKQFALAYLYARQAAAVARPPDLLFVDDAIYSWRCLDELSVSASLVGMATDGRQALDRLVAEGRFPASEQSRIDANVQFYQGLARG